MRSAYLDGTEYDLQRRIERPACGLKNASEIQFQPQLHDARLVGGSHLSVGRAINSRVDALEIRVIEHVEGFDAELHPDSLRHLDVLEQREVPAVNAWSADRPTTSIAGAQHAVGRVCEGVGVEPAICSSDRSAVG